MQISFIATFFNQVLPSTVGGDGMQIWLFARKGADWASAIYSVLLDRIAGVLVSALIGSVPVTYVFSRSRSPIARAVPLVIGAASR